MLCVRGIAALRPIAAAVRALQPRLTAGAGVVCVPSATRRPAGWTSAAGAGGPRATAAAPRATPRQSIAARCSSSMASVEVEVAVEGAVEVQAEETKLPVHQEPQTKYRKDYQPPPYHITHVNLSFSLHEDVTHVLSKLQLQPNHSEAAPVPLTLNGRKDIKLVSVQVNGIDHPASSYTVTAKDLTLRDLPAGPLTVVVATEIKPQDNSSLEGLYKSSGNYCTQCEAEGFRGITYFLDRPDVMAKYVTRIEADKSGYPVLLGNGNLIDSGDLPDGRHFTVWDDPYPKPCYLFALVAGKLAMTERSYTTSSGRNVALRVFTADKDQPKVGHALDSLIKSMKWDEEVFGLEYDLDLFNIVAVDDFNMGAMENKSLNVFNSRLVLASPDTATDLDYARIEGVTAHEYFHNWTGNRVTCRDWFQLTLKEGLTVYRDQEFSADMNSRPVKRIEDVSMLRTSQFTEDAGPMAHPIRPDQYIKMDNFYTQTVYEKGAEVVRMYATLLGKAGFRKGMDLYFKRHDGQAVTCDDFLAAMADANGVDLSQMQRWYSQAGTPRVTVQGTYDAAKQTYTLHCQQSLAPSPGQEEKQPTLIPLAVGLLGPDGRDMPLLLRGVSSSEGVDSAPNHTTVLKLTEAQQEFVFEHVTSEPVPSVLRGFSAPVRLTVTDQTDEHLLFMFAHDSDPFNRWEAGQRLARKTLLQLYEAAKTSGISPTDKDGLQEVLVGAGGVSDAMVAAYRAVLQDQGVDGSFKAMAVSLPSGTELLDALPAADPLLLHQVRVYVNQQLAARLRPELEQLVKDNSSEPGEPYVFSAAATARRTLKNKALALLSTLEDPAITAQLLDRFRSATNMTDQIGALSALVELQGPEREVALGEFYAQWQHEPLVILKWLGLQAMSNAPGNLALVKQLVEHPAFHITNPNNCYSLFLGFSRSPVNFHAPDGSGYEFLADMVLKVDQLNHQVASRMVSAFTTHKMFDQARQDAIRQQLQRIVASNGLSDNVMEVASKSLA